MNAIRTFFIFLCLLYSYPSYSGCEGCAKFIHAEVITIEGTKLNGWYELDSFSEEIFSNKNNSLQEKFERIQRSNIINSNIIIYKHISQIKHPKWWRFKIKNLEGRVDYIEYPLIVLAKKEHTKIINFKKISKLTFSKNIYNLHKGRPYYRGEIRVIPSDLRYKMINKKPYSYAVWDKYRSKHYVYSYNKKYSTKELLIQRLSNIRSKDKSYDLDKIWSKENKFIQDHIVYFPVYNEVE